MKVLHSIPLFWNVLAIAFSIIGAFFFELVIANTAGPAPDMVIPSAPASKAIAFTSSKPGMSFDLTGSMTISFKLH